MKGGWIKFVRSTSREWRARTIVRLVIASLLIIRSANNAYCQQIDSDDVQFDIPTQSLAMALERYGDVTGREVLYNTALLEGRRSGAVKGSFSPETALTLLLKGTGLFARFLPDRSYVLVPAPQPNGQ